MVIAFGRIFEDMKIERFDAQKNVTQVIRVPLTYAPKNKLLLRADQDPDALKTAAVELPHMAFEISPNFEYDGSRKLSPLEKFVRLDMNDANRMKREYVPVPYNMTMNLYVYANKIKDGNKIIEQILPFFTPDWTLNIEFVPDMNLSFDVPIILTNLSLDDAHWDGNFTDRRVLVWNLSFLMKTYFLGPVKSKPIIKFPKTRFIIAPDASSNNDVIANTDILAQINTHPGMTSNGEPTSNAAISVDPNVIYATNTYGYIESFSSNGHIIWE